VGYAIPYARKLYEEYHVGYGILSLQAKESKHAGIKGDLSLTNRSNKSSTNGGKFCAQIMLRHSIFLNTNLHLHHIFLILSQDGLLCLWKN
jgi:hypothetical protein